MTPNIPTPATIKARDHPPSLKDGAKINASINQMRDVNVGSLNVTTGRQWFVFAQEVIVNCCNQNKQLKQQISQQKDEIAELKDKIESLNASVSRSNTIEGIAAFEQHCLTLITPAAIRPILRKVGFASVKEIANSANSSNLRSYGVTHNSPFGKMVFDLVRAGDPSFSKYVENDTTKKLVWDKTLAVPAHQKLQAERNNLAKFGRDVVMMMYHPAPTFTTLNKKNSEESTALWAKVNLSIDQAVQKVNEASGSEATEEEDVPAAEFVHFVESLAGIYSAAHFGRVDSDAWVKHMLPLFANFHKYRARSSTPLGCNRSHETFLSNVKKEMGELVGKTVRDIIQEGAFEALIRTQIVKFVCYIFQHKLDSLMELVKKSVSAPSPNPNDCGNMDEGEFLRNHYIANVSVAKVYATKDIEYFLNLRTEIKQTDRGFDKKRDASGHLILSFPVPEPTDGASSPQPARRRRRTSTAMSTSAAQSPTTLGAMSLLSDSEDDDDTEIPTESV